MKKSINKTQTQEKINNFFQRKDFTPEELKKIKKLAMQVNLKLGKNKRNFCKNCLFPLAGKIRVTKTHKTIVCGNCGAVNKLKL